MAAGTNIINRKKPTRSQKQNKPKQFPLLNLYILIIGILQIIGQLFSIFILRMLKPIPMILMIIYISGKSSQRDHLLPRLVKVGLMLSLVGDLFLMVNEMLGFMIGTAFFLVAHVLYAIGFTIGDPVRYSTRLNYTIRHLVSLIYFLMFIGNTYVLWDIMPNRVLFTTYAFFLCIMNIFAVQRYQKTTPYSYGFITAGAILFGLSDNLLAFLKFNKFSSNLGRAVVMLFYYSGQYLIMHGAMHHSNLQHEITKFLKNTGSNIIPTISIGKSNSKYGSRKWDHGEGQQLPIIDNKNKDQ